MRAGFAWRKCLVLGGVALAAARCSGSPNADGTGGNGEGGAGAIGDSGTAGTGAPGPGGGGTGGSSGSGGSAGRDAGTQTQSDARHDASTPEQSVDGDDCSMAPTVLLLVDQSSSMNQHLVDVFVDPDSPTRWEAIKDALLSPGTGVLRAYENEIRLGIMLYSGDGGYAAGQCPLLTLAPAAAGGRIDFDVGNFDAINAVFGPAMPIEDTPTSEALEEAAAALESVGAPGRKVILLLTDGEPDTCEDPTANFDPANIDRAVATVASIFDRGIRTEVVAVGFDTDAFADAMANAGRGLEPGGGAPYSTPEDPPGIVAAFEAALERALACR